MRGLARLAMMSCLGLHLPAAYLLYLLMPAAAAAAGGVAGRQAMPIVGYYEHARVRGVADVVAQLCSVGILLRIRQFILPLMCVALLCTGCGAACMPRLRNCHEQVAVAKLAHSATKFTIVKKQCVT
jgi:hypothetical protein